MSYKWVYVTGCDLISICLSFPSFNIFIRNVPIQPKVLDGSFIKQSKFPD